MLNSKSLNTMMRGKYSLKLQIKMGANIREHR